LRELCGSAGLEGAAVVDCSDDQIGATILYSAGVGSSAVLSDAARLLRRRTEAVSHSVTADGRPILCCHWVLPPQRGGGLALWRETGAMTWKRSDHRFGASVASLLRVMLESSPEESGIDRMTGLPNRLWFLDEVDRHIERLSRDGLHGTLLLTRINGLETLSGSGAPETLHWLLNQVANLVRATVRATDLIARTGVDEFSVWLAGMDHLTAAERAEALCRARLTLPEIPDIPVGFRPTLSIGIAARPAASHEDVRDLLARARGAAARTRLDGGWLVAP
jgi:diguanylate cyclase (GGDEF)-like protein